MENKNTAAYYFHRLRLLIYQNSSHLEMFEGEIEADESYFGGRQKGKRTWGGRENRGIRAFEAQRQGLHCCRTQYKNCHVNADHPRTSGA